MARCVAARHGDDGRPADVEVRETHISWLFLTADRAYKLKKPLVLDFLDYGSPTRRRAMCRDEVRLNARLAPDVYLGVLGVAPAGRDGADGLLMTYEDDSRAIDYLVEMRRYDESATLAALLASGQLSDGDLRRVGERLARFHRDSPPRHDERGAVRALAEVQRNLAELGGELRGEERLRAAVRVGRFLEAFVAAHAASLDERAAGGHVRKVHGDLRAEHVIVRPRVAVVDCVEFDERLRTIDVADDLAFLVMDLAAARADWATDALMAAYRDAEGDVGDRSLVWFYAAHRALVRGKVALVRAGQPDAAASDERAEADRLLALARRLTWRARGRLAVVACGVPASGKSQLAAALADEYGLSVVNSDVVRKERVGLRPQDRAPTALYTEQASLDTYAAVAERAVRVLDETGAVVVDATFRRRAERDRLRPRLSAAGAAVVFVECTAPPRVLAERARRREAEPGAVSDASAAVAERLRGEWEPLDELPAVAHLVLRTDRPVGQVVGDLCALLDERLDRDDA